MTPEEFGQKLEAITPDEHLAFLRKFAEKRDKNLQVSFVEYLVEHPEDERWLAHLVGLPTEAEKETRSARFFARFSAFCAVISALAAAVSIWQSCSKQVNPAKQDAGDGSNIQTMSTPPNTSLEPTPTAP